MHFLFGAGRDENHGTDGKEDAAGVEKEGKDEDAAQDERQNAPMEWFHAVGVSGRE